VELITAFALGDDVAILLLAVVAIAVGALVASVVLMRRWSALEDAVAPSPWLGSLLTSGVSLALWAGVPALALSLLVVDAMPGRLLRAAMILLGLALGGVSAWLGQRLLVAARSTIDAADAPAASVRTGGLLASSAVAVVALPAAVTVWLLRQGAGEMLLALALGAALTALGLRVVAALAEPAASAATLLAGGHELELDREDEANRSAAVLSDAEMLRHGAGRSAQITAVTAIAVGAGLTVGVPVIATEGIVVAMLGLGVAMAAPLLAMVIPQVGAPGREVAAYRMAGLIPALIAAAGTVAAAALWLPGQYRNLRFDGVGMGSFTDPAVTSTPQPRADIADQLVTAGADLGTYVSQTDESRGASAFLDVLAAYTTHPNTLVAVSIALGAVAAVCGQLLIAAHAAPGGSAARRAARTARTGASIGILAALGGAALWAGLVLSLLALVIAAVGVLAAGIPLLALSLSAFAALGGLLAVTAQAASHAAPVLVDRPGVEEDWRTLVRGRSDEGAAGLGIVAALGALALIAPIVAAVQAAPRAASLWEDRLLHAMTPTSLSVVAGAGLGVVTVLIIASFVMDGQRRLSSAAVLEARTTHLEERSEVSFEGLGLDARRAGLVVLAAAVLMPIVAGFALGPAAVPAYLAALIMVALGLSLWAHAAAGPLAGAVDLIEAGRYGGRGSWAHGGALNGAVLGVSLRAALGELLVPALLVASLTSYIVITMMVGTVAEGVSVYLRVGIALVAALVGLCCWLFARTAPEPDLEDGEATLARPLFATQVDEDADGGLLEMSWDDEDEDDTAKARTPRRAAVALAEQDDDAEDRADDADATEDPEDAEDGSASEKPARSRFRRRR